MRIAPLGRPTVKAGPSYGEWHYPPELPYGWVVVRRAPDGWLVRFKDGTAPAKEERITEADFNGRASTLRVAAALALAKRTPMLTNPDETEDPNYRKAAQKALKRGRRMGELFGKFGAKAGGKAAAKTAAKVGTKTAAKTGAKFVPGVGEVMMVIDAAPEFVRVQKESAALVRESKKRVKAAQGVGATLSELAAGAGRYIKHHTVGTARIGAAALVGSDVVHSVVKQNPQDYRAEIARMLQTMPSDWSRQYNSGRRQLADVGGPALPSRPSPEQAMQMIGITAGGRASGDVPTGQMPIPQEVRDEAMHGLRLSHKNNYGAWDFIGIARAIQLAISPGVTPTTQKRMRNYFTRHRKDASSSKWGNEANPSRGWMAWLNWGGDAGNNWVNSGVAAPARKPQKRRTSMRYNPFENPYFQEARQGYKTCFYIYNDDGTPYLSGDGTHRYCLNAEKIPQLIAEAERRGKRITASPISPGPRTPAGQGPFGGAPAAPPRPTYTPPPGVGPFGAPSRGPAAAPPPQAAPPRPVSTGTVRDRIREHAAKPITHQFEKGNVILMPSGGLTSSKNPYLIIKVSPSSLVVKRLEEVRQDWNMRLQGWNTMPNLSRPPYGEEIRVMLDEAGNPKRYGVELWTGSPFMQYDYTD